MYNNDTDTLKLGMAGPVLYSESETITSDCSSSASLGLRDMSLSVDAGDPPFSSSSSQVPTNLTALTWIHDGFGVRANPWLRSL